MIHHATYSYQSPMFRLSDNWGEKGTTVNSWKAIRDCLEGTHDHIIWIVTITQLHDFMQCVREYNLEKFLVVRSDGEGEGTSNPNYETPKLKLKVFIMKGANNGEIQAGV